MNTSGHGNDALLILVPAGVLLACAVILFGGPAEAFDAVNHIVGEIARVTIKVVSSVFS